MGSPRQGLHQTGTPSTQYWTVIRLLEMAKHVECLDHPDQDTGLVHHKEAMHVKRQHFTDDAAGGKVTRYREYRRRHDVSYGRLFAAGTRLRASHFFSAVDKNIRGRYNADRSSGFVNHRSGAQTSIG